MAITNDSPPPVFILITAICIGIALAVSFAIVSADGQSFFHVTNSSADWVGSVEYLALISFAMQWLFFIPAGAMKTEKFYDLVGSLTFITLTVISLVFGYEGAQDGTGKIRKIVCSACVLVWTLRLVSLLFPRIMRAGKDDRFDAMLGREEGSTRNLVRFWNAWSIQGLWVFLTAIPVYTCNWKQENKPLCIADYIGWSIWFIGFSIEAISDTQKTRFKNNAANKGKFIDSGLWRYSRHPNYFGEITLWIGLFISCAVDLKNQQWVTIIGPLLVIFLLTKVSGIPMLERKSDEKYGKDPEYRKYKAETSALIPMMRKRVPSSAYTPLNTDQEP